VIQSSHCTAVSNYVAASRSRQEICQAVHQPSSQHHQRGMTWIRECCSHMLQGYSSRVLRRPAAAPIQGAHIMAQDGLNCSTFSSASAKKKFLMLCMMQRCSNAMSA
jgi:hypothetical protein